MLKNLSLKNVSYAEALWVLPGTGRIMKEENKELIKDFLGKIAFPKEGLLADKEKTPDRVPVIIDIMRDMPSLLRGDNIVQGEA